MIDIHYALQICDLSSNQNLERYCSNDRTLISKKCIKSFFQAIKFVSESNSDVRQTIRLFNDKSSKSLLDYVNNLIVDYSTDNIVIELETISESGVMNSIKCCYDWLKLNGKDLVYQVQDDFLFYEDSIYQMIDIFMQIYSDTNQLPIISGYNDPYYWVNEYKYRPTPRMVVPGSKQYWIQNYNLSCSFMTSRSQFSKNWDLLEYFCSLNPKEKVLENVSLNKILVDRNQLGLIPFTSVCLHMQSETEKDPYLNWKSLWDEQIVE